METIIDSIIEILKQISINEQYLLNRVSFLEKGLFISLIIMLCLNMYSIYFIIYSIKRMNKFDKKLEIKLNRRLKK